MANFQTYERGAITFPDGSTISITAPGGKWRAFAEKMNAGHEPETSMLAVGPRCAGCGTPEPPDAYALGWRSQTCDTPPDFHALLCPTCQQGDGDRLDRAR